MKEKKPAKEIKNPGFTNTQAGAMLEAVHKEIKTIGEGHSGLEKGLENLRVEIHGNSKRIDWLETTSRIGLDKIGRLEDAVSLLSKDLKETRKELKDTRDDLKNDIKELGIRLISVESSHP